MDLDPKLDVLINEPARRDPGLIVLTVGRNTRSINKTSKRELIIALDRDDGIVWQRDMPFGLMDCRLSLSDSLLVMGSSGRIAELDFDGTTLREWYSAPRHPDGIDGAIALPTTKLHHSVCELPDGKLATLSVELLSGAGDDELPDVMVDTVLIFDRDGSIEAEFSLAPLLDLERQSHSHRIPYWPLQGWPGCADWTHGNSITVDPLGGLIISMRHQDAVIKVTRTGELVWILGTPDGWREPWSEKVLRIEGGRPFFHQHDAAFTEDGTLLLFDNGTAGSFPPTPAQELADRESFALGYRIDEGSMTAREVWRYGGADLPFTDYVSGVTQMPNGNRYIACTGIKRTATGERIALPPQGIGSIELFELTPDDELVFHARMHDPAAGPDDGWNGFRPQYLPAGTLAD